VSNDNPYSESIFNTLKHRAQLPVRAFADIASARNWALKLVTWYNEEHRHSSISFVTPSQRHAGQDIELPHPREAFFEAAKQAHPKRWSGSTRNWKRKLEVHLNPNSTQIKAQKTSKKTA
jgi:putative transposase